MPPPIAITFGLWKWDDSYLRCVVPRIVVPDHASPPDVYYSELSCVVNDLERFRSEDSLHRIDRINQGLGSLQSSNDRLRQAYYYDTNGAAVSSPQLAAALKASRGSDGSTLTVKRLPGSLDQSIALIESS